MNPTVVEVISRASASLTAAERTDVEARIVQLEFELQVLRLFVQTPPVAPTSAPAAAPTAPASPPKQQASRKPTPAKKPDPPSKRSSLDELADRAETSAPVTKPAARKSPSGGLMQKEQIARWLFSNKPSTTGEIALGLQGVVPPANVGALLAQNKGKWFEVDDYRKWSLTPEGRQAVMTSSQGG